MKFWFIYRGWRWKKTTHHNSLRVHTNTVRHRAAIGCARCHLLFVRKFQQGQLGWWSRDSLTIYGYKMPAIFGELFNFVTWRNGGFVRKRDVQKQYSYCYRSDNSRTNQQIATSKWYPTLPSSKLRWQWKVPIFNRNYVFKLFVFHCYVSSKVC